MLFFTNGNLSEIVLAQAQTLWVLSWGFLGGACEEALNILKRNPGPTSEENGLMMGRHGKRVTCVYKSVSLVAMVRDVFLEPW